ncbi:MAG TPA: D-arabinono-1,4-lactone oxidase [Nostocaceae cyanobacterium]|nr:D-arabinono-1,4-lactone oxidase [Nostocaceae cyanobacterium]
MKQTVCITGGSGGIGQTLLKYLLETFHVKALFRKENTITTQWQKQGCEIILGDLKNEASLINLVTETKFVFHCAALTTSLSSQTAHTVNVEGTRKLAEVAAKSGCQRFIHLSSVAVYTGATQKNPVYLESVQLREDPAMELYCLTKLRAELALIEVAKQHKLEYTILRPTCVYGVAIPSYTMIPFNSIQKGLPVILGDGEGELDIVYVDDVVQAVLLAANSPQANGEIFNIGGERIKIKDFYAVYGQMLQRPVRHLPKPIINFMVGLAKIHREFGKSLKWYQEVQEKSEIYPSTKAKKILGYHPQVPLSIGMLKTELWLKDNGYIPEKRRILWCATSLYNFSPRAVVHPNTETEIIQIIQIAAKQKLKVKTIGAIHSLAPIPATEGVCIVLDQYKNLVKIAGSLVTIQAGMKLWELNAILAKHNLALPVLGAIDQQTVSGAISTGTHGCSWHDQSLSSCVQAIRIIRSDSSVIEVDQSEDIFDAILISMGLLGIISTVTFKCVPAFYLQSQKIAMPMENLLQSFEEINQSNQYVSIRYAPITDYAQILLINPTLDFQENGGCQTINKSELQGKLDTLITKLALHIFNIPQLNWLQRLLIKRDEKTVYASPFGRSDFVFTHLEAPNYNPLPMADTEIAIPYTQAVKALSVLRDFYQKNQRYPNIYVHIRCTAEDNFWLSPAYKQRICWLEFWEYPRSSDFFQEIIELLKPFNFRCHWGKQILVEPEYIKQQYKKWDDFVQLRQEWDAQLMFANSYLDKYFAAPNIG